MRALIFDTETSGLPKHHFASIDSQPHILEFAGIIVQHEEDEIKEVERFSFYCNPGIKISEEITRINGISNETIKHEKKFDHHAEFLSKKLQGINRVVAHNLPFDMKMVNFEYRRIGEKAPWPNDQLCTIEATSHLKGYRLKLIDLHQFLFDEGFEGAHRAMNDTQALAKCYGELVKRRIV